MHKKTIYFFLLVLTAAGCKSVQQGLFSKQSPHEEYTLKLEEAGLINNKLGQVWIQAAENGLLKPTEAGIPYSEAMVFDYEQLTSTVYTVFLHEGQKLHVLVEPEQSDTSDIFIDLFRLTNGEYKQEAYAEKDSMLMNYRIRRDGEYLIRIQPELMVMGLYTVYLFTDASLNFPVPGRDFNSISSFFGDPREGGRRKHEGVDVFAPRGTPALAVSSGKVTRTGTNRLGGKVVWVSDTKNGYNYYYAHLDSQLVRPGMHVNTGDTVGLIGNSGNAVTTPPHLHFGIYAFGRRSIDPYVFFHKTDMPVIDSIQIARFADSWGQTTADKNNFRSAPNLNADITEPLPANMPIKIRGVAGNWLNAELPAGTRGYIHQSLVKPMTASGREIIAAGKIIRSRPDDGSRAKKVIAKDEKVKIYAQYESYLLVNTGDIYGWIEEGS